MPNQPIRILICLLVLPLLSAVVAGALIARHARGASPSTNLVSSQHGAASRVTRNLSLHPEAFRVALATGQRFSARNKHERSIFVGTLTVGSERMPTTIIRNQAEDGEEVQIQIANSPGAFTWDRNRGALTNAGRAVGSNRDLIERLVFDSPDQFVLAQLRGASYFTVARNMRSESAVDGTAAPLWDVIRVEDSERDAEKRPRSSWRLYYLNCTTGLIDRIVSEVEGQRIETEISSWAEVNGEKVPAHISWSRQGQTVMQYTLSSFSRAER